MTGLEWGIASALRDHAEGEVDVSALLDGARVRGRSRIRRRRLTVAGAGALTLGLLGGVALGVPHHRQQNPLPPIAAAASASTAPSATVAPSVGPTAWPDLPRPPLAPKALPARANPSVVGSDAGLFHLDLTGLTDPVTVAQWDSFDRWERLFVQEGNRTIQAVIAPDVKNFDSLSGALSTSRVNGATATLALDSTHDGDLVQVRWQPESGLWAQVSVGGDEKAALSVATGLRIDRVYRCAVPFRLDKVPADAQVQSCRLVIDGAGSSASVTVGTGSWSLTIGDERGSVDPDSKLGRWPAHVQEFTGDGKSRVLQVDLDLGDHVVDATAEGGYDRAAVLAAMASYREVAPYDQPASWTGGPLG